MAMRLGGILAATGAGIALWAGAALAQTTGARCVPIDQYGQKCVELVRNERCSGFPKYACIEFRNHCDQWMQVKVFDHKGGVGSANTPPGGTNSTHCTIDDCGGWKSYEVSCTPRTAPARRAAGMPGTAASPAQPPAATATTPTAPAAPSAGGSAAVDLCGTSAEANRQRDEAVCTAANRSKRNALLASQTAAGGSLVNQRKTLELLGQHKASCMQARQAGRAVSCRPPGSAPDAATQQRFERSWNVYSGLGSRLDDIAAAWRSGDQSVLAREGLPPSPAGVSKPAAPPPAARQTPARPVQGQSVASKFQQCVAVEFFAYPTPGCTGRSAMCTQDGGRNFVCVAERDIPGRCPGWNPQRRANRMC